MAFPMKELARQFESETGIKPEIILGSSGKLTAQILAGAPFDLFVSADTSFPNIIYKRKKQDQAPKIYAYGQLVLISNQIDSIGLMDRSIKNIAIPNPKTAPYGKAAIDYLKNAQILDALSSKLIYGESVSQTNQFIFSKTVDLGITNQSVVFSPQIEKAKQWTFLDESLYQTIAQGSLVLNPENKDAIAFGQFLLKSESRRILKKYGYLLPE